MQKLLEQFIQMIVKPDIYVKEFTMYGFNKNVTKKNWGYIPFYTPSPIEIENGLVDPVKKDTRPGITRSKVEWIVYHETGNTNSMADARGHMKYVQSGPRGVSWHFTVDDHKIYQHIPIHEVAWHAGDGTRAKGDWSKDGVPLLGGGNMSGVGVETCVHEEVDYNKVMRLASKLIGSKLLFDCDLTIDKVKQHYDFSGKNCPQSLREAGRFQEVLDLIAMEYFAKQHKLEECYFNWTTLTPKYLDKEGYIIHEPKEGTKVSYMVNVTKEGMNYSFGPFTSTIHYT